MENSEKNWPEDFRHKTETGPDGEITYAYPVEVGSKLEGYDKDTLDYFKISKNDCHSICYTETDVVYVHYLMISNKDVAQDQWAYLNSRHSREYAHDRCLIPGTRKNLILCPDTRSCKNCPYSSKKQKRIISLDKYTYDGNDISEMYSAEDVALANIEQEELIAFLKAEDPRIAKIYRLLQLEYEPKEIAVRLRISQSRVYQLIKKAQETINKFNEG